MNKTAAIFLLLLCHSVNVKAGRNKNKRNAVPCGVRGECRGGKKLKLFGSQNGHFDSCHGLCSKLNGCTHFTFYDNKNERDGDNYDLNKHDKNNLCLLFDGCPEVDQTDRCVAAGNCLTGDVGCNLANNSSTSACFFKGI